MKYGLNEICTSMLSNSFTFHSMHLYFFLDVGIFHWINPGSTRMDQSDWLSKILGIINEI